LESITRTQKIEGIVATPDGPGGPSYSENWKAKTEAATADNFEIFRERGKMMSQRLVKISWNEKGVDNYF
jgi:hypothetical protein